ncbi:MAG: hypothetical protein WD016_07080 [Balneolaceae bacterium]
MYSKKDDFVLTGNKYELPEAIEGCKGMNLGGHQVRSILLSTDLSYILNLKADAIMVINPFEKSEHLNKAITSLSKKPVLCDIGGGFLKEELTIKLSKSAFEFGAAGVVISKPTSYITIQKIRDQISGPLIYTVMFAEEKFSELAGAGVDIFNVSTGETTAETVAEIRSEFPEIPIMANGGPYDSTIYETIENGADAIVFNPPTATEMLRSIFDGYRINRG